MTFGLLFSLLGFQRLIVVLLAHATENRLLGAAIDSAHLLLGSMRNAPSALYSHLLAIGNIAALPGGTMRAAKTRLLDILVASFVFARLALGPVRNAKTALHNTVGAASDGTLAAYSFAGGQARCKLLGGGVVRDNRRRRDFRGNWETH